MPGFVAGLWAIPGRAWSLCAHSGTREDQIGATPPAFRPQPQLEGEARAPFSSTLGKAPKGPSHTAILRVCEAPGRGKHPEQRRSPSAPCSRPRSRGVGRGGWNAPDSRLCTTPWTSPSSSRPGPREHPHLTAAATGRGVPRARLHPGPPHCSARGSRLPLPPSVSPSLPSSLSPRFPPAHWCRTLCASSLGTLFPLAGRPLSHPAQLRDSAVWC